MNAKLDWFDIQETAIAEKRIIALTDVGAILILACNTFYRQRYYWQYQGEDLNETQWDEVGHAIGLMEHEIMSGLIGAIIPHVMASISGLTMLPCEGSTYNRVDYPLLYEAIDAEFIIDADTFRVPDLRDKFPLGAGDNFPIATEGGEENHTLTIAEMPAHSHTNVPHTHSEITAIASVAQIVVAPTPSAIPSAGATGASSVTIDPSGGDEAHNNMPPFFALRWAIVAG